MGPRRDELMVQPRPVGQGQLLANNSSIFVLLGRERRTRAAALATGRESRAGVGSRRVDFQTVCTAVDHLAEPEILPNAREPQLQYRSEHGETDLQL